MDSDAVFHEESEYIIGFKIPTTNDGLSSIFWKKYFLLFAKNAKKSRKSIWPVFLEKQARTGKVFLPKWSARKKLYKPWKFQWDSNVVAGLTWRNLIDIPR